MMSDFVPDLIADTIFAGVLQTLSALPVAAVLCLSRRRGSLLCLFALFNLFLFVWSIFGNAVWRHLTDHRLAVLDDAPVWSPVFPFGRAMLDHAAGGSDGWQLLGTTSLGQLRIWWGATAFAVWLLASLSLWVWLRFRTIRRLRGTKLVLLSQPA